MPSFDIVSKVDAQLLDNAVNNLKKEILNRFDFQGSETEIEFDKKDYKLTITTESDMRLCQIEDVMISKFLKQGIDPRSIDKGKEHYASGKMIRKDYMIHNGMDKDQAKKVNKMIKDSGLKVQGSIMDDKIRVTGKKIDDLQEVMQLLKKSEFELPLQFENMKS